MVLILEIWLCIKAFRNGWGGRALIPFAVVLAASTFIGFAAGLEGASAESMTPVALLLDLVLIATLVVMARRAPADSAPTATETLSVTRHA